jgi:hypothetical protein
VNAEMNIEDFLNEVATRDLKQVFSHSYVFPKKDVGDRLKTEIAAKTGCTVELVLSDSPELLLANRFLSAAPEKFVPETLRRMAEVVRGLKHEKAKSFDLIFSNPAEISDPTYHWGDQVQFRVRFAK